MALQTVTRNAPDKTSDHLTFQYHSEIVDTFWHVRVLRTQGIFGYDQRPLQQRLGLDKITLRNRQRVGVSGGQEVYRGPS